MEVYPQEMIRTIARCMFIVPAKWIQVGFDWPAKQREWESLSNHDKQIWYDIASSWLNELKISRPDAYEFYINNWMSDFGSRNHLFTD